MNVSAYQEKNENENTGKKEAKEEQKNSEPILKRLIAALVRPFQRAARRKTICLRGVPGKTGTFGKANKTFRRNSNEIGDRTTTMRRLWIGADQSHSRLKSPLCPT